MKDDSAALFDISTVSRLTGLTAPNIRVWEKRYEVVEPQRSESGRRLYTERDVRRLTLLKSLADLGHPIRSTAPLDDADLELRLRQAMATENEGEASGSEQETGPCRVAVIGHHMITLLREDEEGLRGTEVIAEFETLEAAETGNLPERLDLLIVESPTLFKDTAERVRRLVDTTRALRAIVVYDFAQQRTLEMMEQSLNRITAIRSPVDLVELRIACAADIAIANHAALPVPEHSHPDETVPERRFSDRQIAKISRISTAIDCECPQHLAGLLKSLIGFEKYSLECESRNAADAEVHAYLHRKTASARSVVEEALSFLVEFEGIEVGD